MLPRLQRHQTFTALTDRICIISCREGSYKMNVVHNKLINLGGWTLWEQQYAVVYIPAAVSVMSWWRSSSESAWFSVIIRVGSRPPVSPSTSTNYKTINTFCQQCKLSLKILINNMRVMMIRCSPFDEEQSLGVWGQQTYRWVFISKHSSLMSCLHHRLDYRGGGGGKR